MTRLRLEAVTALCVTNRAQFVPNILRQWLRTGAPSLVVVIDAGEWKGDEAGFTFAVPKVREIAELTYEPKATAVGDNAVIEWDNVKIVVAMARRKTIGDCRNLAIRYADTPYFTWMDDDDIQRRHRVPLVIALAGKVSNNHVLVRGGQPLLDIASGKLRPRPKNLSWLEGIYLKGKVKPFPGLSMSEDYHWMQQFHTDEDAHRIMCRYPLAVHVKHLWNTSDVRRLSMASEFWSPPEAAILEPCWLHAVAQWNKDLGLGLELLE